MELKDLDVSLCTNNIWVGVSDQPASSGPRQTGHVCVSFLRNLSLYLYVSHFQTSMADVNCIEVYFMKMSLVFRGNKPFGRKMLI
jgi:hypothetical protein